MRLINCIIDYFQEWLNRNYSAKRKKYESLHKLQFFNQNEIKSLMQKNKFDRNLTSFNPSRNCSFLIKYISIQSIFVFHSSSHKNKETCTESEIQYYWLHFHEWCVNNFSFTMNASSLISTSISLLSALWPIERWNMSISLQWRKKMSMNYQTGCIKRLKMILQLFDL